MSWREHAACAGADPESFSPVEWWTTDEAEVVEAAARRWCAGCPVLAACARFADTSRHTGLWGGGMRRIKSGRYVWHPMIEAAPRPELADRRVGVRGAAWAS